MVNLFSTQENNVKSEYIYSCKQLVKKETCHVFQWWNSIAREGVPAWEKFDILDFMEFSQSISVCRRLEETRFQFIVQGERTLELLGRNRVFKAELSKSHKHIYERQLYAYYDLICKSEQPHFYRGPIIGLDKDYVTFEGVDLPFKSKSGEVDTILSLLVVAE